MADLATTPFVNENEIEALAPEEETQRQDWDPSAIVSDIATLGIGTLLAGLFNIALVFVVPKVLSMEDYGYWRIFGLYAGYAGFLHFGFVDGALLRWAGRRMQEFHPELWPAMKYLFWQQIVILVPFCGLAALLWPGPLRFVVIAVAVYALLYNITATLQFALQGARVFQPVAISTVAARAPFLGLLLLFNYKWGSNYREVTALYLVGYVIVLLLLLGWTRPWTGLRPAIDLKTLAKACVLSGWPIVIANTGLNIVQFADRLALSWAATIQNFAQYSLAASTMMVPVTAIQSCSQVFFSHLAGVTPRDRARIYGISSRVLLIAWAILLPYYFALDVFIRHFLPKYLPSLGYARILLLGIPFLAVIQILQMSFANLHGMQKRFLACTAVVLALGLGGLSLAVFHASSLRVIAAVQVAILGAWWLLNEGSLRHVTRESMRDWAKFLGIYVLASGSYWLATRGRRGVAISILAYYLLVSTGLLLIARSDLSRFVRLTKWRRKARPGAENAYLPTRESR